MAGILVAPDLDLARVTRRGILTVPGEDALVSCRCNKGPCPGVAVNDIPLSARTLELYVRAMGDRFVERLKVRGYEWLGTLMLHGPFESYEFNQRLADVESEAWKRAEREDDLSYTLPFVFERAASPYKDYLLVGDFLHRNVLTEIIIKEADDG